MAGIKTAPVIRLFRTPVLFTDVQIAGLLRDKNITVTPFGKGGFPPKDVYHLEDWENTWVGSRVDGNNGRVLAFFSDAEEDPIFAAVRTFATEITGENKDKLKAEIEASMAERQRVITKNKKGEIWGDESQQT